MFSIRTLQTTLSLPPSQYNSNIPSSLENILQTQSIVSNFGLTIAIPEILSISQFPIDIDGTATFKITYKALILNLRIGEVVDLQVIEVNDSGMFLSLSEETTDHFTVFVSSMQMKGEAFGMQRVKILGSKMEGHRIVAIGTVRDECLGVIN